MMSLSLSTMTTTMNITGGGQMRLEFTREEIEAIRDMLVKEASRLRYELSVLYKVEDKLSDAFYSEKNNESNDDSEEV